MEIDIEIIVDGKVLESGVIYVSTSTIYMEEP
jgi:hypothetical protein